MLTPDLVRTRKSGTRLLVTALTPKARARALELSLALLSAATSDDVCTRGELKAQWASLLVGARERKLYDGLAKLVEDACEFEQVSEPSPLEVRRRLFRRAAELRKAGSVELDRDGLLAEVGAAFGLEAAQMDAVLFADLKSEHRLVQRPTLDAEALVRRYEAAQYQAVLLRAVRVSAVVQADAPGDYRALFRALKFRRLLHTIEPVEQGYRIEIDGPFSLFESVTKYGLQLALLWPHLLACGTASIRAEVLWGKSRTPLTFSYEQQRAARSQTDDQTNTPELDRLVSAFDALDTRWSVAPSDRILHVPGLGICVPDLVFECAGQRVYFELLGFWSRDAVFKRIELVEAGLNERIVFAVSERLRVSEELLSSEDSARLLVFKGTLSARQVQRRLDALSAEQALDT